MRVPLKANGIPPSTAQENLCSYAARLRAPSTMHRSSLLIIAIGAPLLAFACSDYTGQNLLETLPDGRTRIPVYEAGPPIVFDGSFDSSLDAASEAEAQATDAAPDNAVDAGDASKEGGREGSADAPLDSPHEGAKG